MLAIRGAIVLLILAPVIVRSGGWRVFRTTRPFTHALRVGFGLVSLVAFFEALRRVPLATLIAIGFVGPLFLTLLSILVLKERVGIHRWSAVICGLAGVLLIVRPTTSGLDVWALVGALAALGWSASSVVVRLLARTDSDITLLAIMQLGTFAVLAIASVFVWRPIALLDFGLILVMAVALTAGHWGSIRALRLAPVSAVAPFQYIELLYATFFGWYFWNEWPAEHVWFGAAVVVASGLYVIWRERVRAIATSDSRS
jgi:drug/metabolite transporter (DMT)-like permease